MGHVRASGVNSIRADISSLGPRLLISALPGHLISSPRSDVRRLLPIRLTGLWRDRDFVKLWSGSTVSAFGSQISFLALPLTAVLVLDATPLQMGIVAATSSLPSLLFGLGAGVWLDRRTRRPVMIAADYGRAFLIATIPVAAALGVLRMEHLYAVAFGVGTLSLLFAVASQSMLPLLVGRSALVEANSKLAIGRSGSEVVGPGVAGTLVHLATAPAALVVDAVTFVVSALCIQSIRAVEPEPEPVPDRGTFIDEAREGFSLVTRNRVLLALGGLIGTLAVFNAMFEAVWILYVSQDLDLSPSALGILFSIGGVGFVIGASIANRVVRKIGLGPTILLGALLAAVSDLATPLAGGPLIAIFVTLIPAMLGFGIGATVYGVGQMSLVTSRQVV